jgi:hypothetical protein
VHIVIISHQCQVTGNRDAFFLMITRPKTRSCVVERKTPRLVKVESNKSIRPHAHPMEFCHVFRVGGKPAEAQQLSTVSPD